MDNVCSLIGQIGMNCLCFKLKLNRYTERCCGTGECRWRVSITLESLSGRCIEKRLPFSALTR